MYFNIEKNDLTIVADNPNYQPNVIRFTKETRKKIENNVQKVQVSMKDDIQDFPSIEEEFDYEQGVGETTTANLFFISTSKVGEIDKPRPINLTSKMINNMFRKHDEAMKRLDDRRNLVTEQEEMEKVFDAIDSIEKEDVQPQKEQVEDNHVNEVREEVVVENKIDNATSTEDDFINLIKAETQIEKEFAIAKERLEKTSQDLERAKEIKENEIVKNYELENAIREEKEKQQVTLRKQAEVIKLRISSLKTAKAEVEMDTEQKNNELESTNADIYEIRKNNNNLLEIYNAIINNSSSREQTDFNDEEVENFRRVA